MHALDESKRLHRLSSRNVSIALAFGVSLCYSCSYIWRLAVFVANMKGRQVYGVDLLTALSTAQVAAYAIGKPFGLRVITSLKRTKRFPMLIMLLITSYAISTLPFAIFPNAPIISVIGVFVGSLPSSWTYSLLLTYVEGRSGTDFISAVLCAFVVIAGAAARAIGAAAADTFGDRMPLVVGGIALVPACALAYFIEHLPPPSAADVAHKSGRRHMSMRECWEFVRSHFLALLFTMLAYSALTALRFFRDLFAKPIYSSILGHTPSAGTYLLVDLPAAAFAALFLASLSRVHSNRNAVAAQYGMALIGATLILVSALAFTFISGYVFLILLALGVFAAYLPLSTSIYDRLLAATSTEGTSVFLVFAADCSGYVATIALFVWQATLRGSSDDNDGDDSNKTHDFDYASVFVALCVALAATVAALLAVSLLLWWRAFARVNQYQTLQKDSARSINTLPGDIEDEIIEDEGVVESE